MCNHKWKFKTRIGFDAVYECSLCKAQKAVTQSKRWWEKWLKQ